MNDYMKLIAHAAAKFTGRPALLSPLLDSYCEWENKRSRFSSEPIAEDFRIVLSAGGLALEELKIECDEQHLRICMQHDSKVLGENNYKWSRDCTYEYPITDSLEPFKHHFAAYWTNDDFLVIQARKLECPFIKESIEDGLQKFKLIPVEVIDVLEPSLNTPFLKQISTTIKKKSEEVTSYVNIATAVSEANDVLALLTCIPLLEDKKMKFDFEKLMQDDQEADESHSSQEDSEDQSPSKKSSAATKRRGKGSKK